MSAKTAAPAAKSPALYDLLAALGQVNTWAQEEAKEHDGELPGWLEELQLEAEEAVEVKLERIRRFIAAQQREIGAIEGELGAVRKEAERLIARRTTRENRIDNMKRYVVAFLGANGLTKIETPLGAVSKQNAGGVRKLEVLCEPAVLLQYEDTKGFVKEVKPEPYFDIDHDGLRKMMEASQREEFLVEDPENAEDNKLPPVPIVKLYPRNEIARFW